MGGGQRWFHTDTRLKGSRFECRLELGWTSRDVDCLWTLGQCAGSASLDGPDEAVPTSRVNNEQRWGAVLSDCSDRPMQPLGRQRLDG